MHQFTKLLGIVTALGLTATAPITAQDHPMPMREKGGMPGMSARMEQEMKGMMQEMQGMMHEMMGVHAYGPAILLDGKADLSLTTDQVKKLEALSAEVKIAKEHARAAHDVNHARVIAQFKLAQPDAAKVKADGQEAMQDMAAAHGAELSAAARAKSLLTDAQRAKVEAWIAEHGKMPHSDGMKMDHKDGMKMDQKKG